MATPLANDLITNTLKRFNCLTPRHDRQLGIHTATATLLIRVLDISGMG